MFPRQLQRIRDHVEDMRQTRDHRKPIILIPGKKWAYVAGFTEKRKLLFDGPMWDDEASRLADTLEDSEIFHYPTIDQARATKMWKAEMLKRGLNPDEALRKVLHRRPQGE